MNTIQTTNAPRLRIVDGDGKTQSTWTLIAAGANTVAVKDGVIFSSWRAFGKMEQLRRMAEPVSWRGNDIVIGSVVYRVVTRLPDGAYVVEAVASGR